MKNHIIITLVGMALLLAFTTPAAVGELERMGPVSQINGYPAWYQDKTGLALEFGAPLNQAELDGGWTLLLPADVPSGTAPETFPTNFSEEHFYWAADAGVDFPAPGGGTGKALLVLALEAAFSQGPVAEGDQIVFGRIRVRIDPLPFSGTYTIYTPYNVWSESGTAGDRLFVTEDIGFNAPAGTFDAALLSNIGPFLLPSDTPGGAELPPVFGPVLGKRYIADPAREGPVTGSPLPPFVSPLDGIIRDHNIFRVEGPNGWVVETTNFALMGRVYTGTIAGKVTIDRASYTRTETEQKLDIFATAFPATQGRIPGSPPPPTITPVLSYFNAPPDVDPFTGELTAPAGFTNQQMFGAGSNYWGQSQPLEMPVGVTVEDETSRDANGQVVPTFFGASVTDEVTITEAYYDPAHGGSLFVRARSSDEVGQPTLTLGGFGELVNGEILVAPLAAPPAKVRVRSVAGGLAERQVTTSLLIPNGGNIPKAQNDEATTLEDTPVTIPVLANDTVGGSPIVFGPEVAITIVGTPQLGTAVINQNGEIDYTPFVNANGTEGISYTVSVNGITSNVAYVVIHITPVSDGPPVAVDDSVSGVSGVPIGINVLANDTDPDGPSDLANAVNLTLTGAPIGGSPTMTGGAGGIVTFTATTPGTYTFTYQAQDQSGLTSDPSTVTVTVAAAETITVTQALFRTSQNRWKIDGTDSVPLGQALTISYANGAAAGFVIGTTTVDAAGAWAFEARGATGLFNPTTLNPQPTQIRVTSSTGGDSGPVTFTVRR